MTGLDKFRDHFRQYSDQYVLIGGTACDLLMDEAGLDFRLTKDLDIVLHVEALDPEFVKAFWNFVRAGDYQTRQTTTGERRCYRFEKPQIVGYPAEMELFARKPEMLVLTEDSHLTPIPIDADISSLSAIVMNDDYYAFLNAGKRIIGEIPIIDTEHLIPLKARAWLDLMRRKTNGETVDSKKIVKHKNDVFRLYRILDPGIKSLVPPEIQQDMKTFLDAMQTEEIDLRSLGIRGNTKASIIAELTAHYINEIQ